MGDTNQSTNLERVLFEIDADPRLVTTKSFADISAYSCFTDESEVLFMLGSIFRLDSIVHGDDHVWIIRMALCTDDELHLKEVLTDMKNQHGIGETNFHTLGKVLWNMVKLDLAEKYYTRLINELPPNNFLLRTLYEELSKIASQLHHFDKSIQLHKKSLDIKDQLSPTINTNNVFQTESSMDIDAGFIRTLVYQTAITVKQTVEQVKANENQCKRLEVRIDAMVTTLKCINDENLQRSEIRKSLMDFCICIEHCLAFVTKFQNETSWFFKVFSNHNSKDQFEKLNAQLLQCAIDLHLEINLKQLFDHEQDELDQKKDLNSIQNRLDEIASMMVQQQQQQLRHLQGIDEHTKQRYNSYRHHLEQNINRTDNPIKAKELKNEEQSFLRIPYYDLIQEQYIGEGGFADVYRGRWISQDLEVAIKVIRVQYLGERTTDDFMQEISTMQRIRYEHILNMFGASMEPGKYALVVEYMSLGSLYDVLRQQRIQFAWPDRWLIALQMAKGINYLHTLPKPIIHRDIKSHNVLVTEGIRGFLVKIGDFGLAKIRRETSQQSTHGPIVGTLPWKAPELLKMGRHTEASDIYALGIVFWELATGCEPYEDADDATISAYVKGGDRLDIPEDIPESFAELITKSWAHAFKQRPTSQELVYSLKEQCSKLEIPETFEEKKDDDNESERLIISTNEELEITTARPNNVRHAIPLTNSTRATTDIIMEHGIQNDTTNHTRFSDLDKEHNRIMVPITGFQRMPLVSLEEAIKPLITSIPSIQSFAFVAKQRCKKPANNLTTDESTSIMLYTMDWEPADQSLYALLNAALRAANRSSLKPWFAYLKLLFTALSRLPSQLQTVYRGIKLDMSASYKPRTTMIWWGFSSCTTSIDTLQSASFLGEQGTRTIFVIECITGKNIDKHSYFPEESEVLLLAATQFEVVSCLKQGHGLNIIQLREIEPPVPLIDKVFSSCTSSVPTYLARPAFDSTLSENLTLGPPDQYIFLSYEATDKLIIDKIAKILTKARGNVWTNDMIHSHKETDIADAITKAWVFICFPTLAYQNSNLCRKELCFADKNEKKIIAVMIKSNWTPSSWLAWIIGSLPTLHWENIQPDDVEANIPDLLQRLSHLNAGNLPKRCETSPGINAIRSSPEVRNRTDAKPNFLTKVRNILRK